MADTYGLPRAPFLLYAAGWTGTGLAPFADTCCGLRRRLLTHHRQPIVLLQERLLAKLLHDGHPLPLLMN